MKESTVKLATRDGNIIVKCKIKESKIFKFNFLSDVTFSYKGFFFILEENKAKGGLVGKSIETKNGKTLVTWVKVCPKSEVFKNLKRKKKNYKKTEYGSIEWLANGMIGE